MKNSEPNYFLLYEKHLVSDYSLQEYSSYFQIRKGLSIIKKFYVFANSEKT